MQNPVKVLIVEDEPNALTGLAELISPHTEVVDHVEPWLTLEGLRIVYERNVGNGGAVGR